MTVIILCFCEFKKKNNSMGERISKYISKDKEKARNNKYANKFNS